MILTATPAIEGHTIGECKGVTFGEVITGVRFSRTLPQASGTAVIIDQERVRYKTTLRKWE